MFFYEKAQFMVMVTLQPDIIDTSMTLVLAVNNSSTVVVGVDTLRQKKHENGSYETLYDAKKLWEVAHNCVILVAGRDFSFDRIDQFILDFTELIKELKITDASYIVKKFEQKIQRVPGATLTNLEFIIAGYSNKKPVLYYTDNTQNFEFTPCINGYAIAGKQSEAREIIAKLPSLSNMNTKDLEKAVCTILFKVHFKYPSEVGGDLRVRQL